MIVDKHQEAAIDSDAKNILTVAGAGSGKTYTLVERINYLLYKGVPSEDIAAITFTNVAAEEMRKRIVKDFNGYIGTIHSLGTTVLKENNISSSIWHKKSDKFNKLLEVSRPYLKKRFNYVLVDELQDITDNEFMFIQAIDAESYFMVGDDWQSIYQFRGGNTEIFFDLIRNKDFEKHYLINNYRSASQISSYGYNIISNLSGPKIDKYMNTTVDIEGAIYKIKVGEGMNRIKQEGNYGNWMVLSRLNRELDFLAKLLNERGIPFVSFKKSELTHDEIEGLMNKNVVKLLTIHSAKGLESENVMVYKNNMGWDDDEVKVAYVAATRAKKNLYLCDNPIRGHNIYGLKYLNTYKE